MGCAGHNYPLKNPGKFGGQQMTADSRVFNRCHGILSEADDVDRGYGEIDTVMRQLLRRGIALS